MFAPVNEQDFRCVFGALVQAYEFVAIIAIILISSMVGVGMANQYRNQKGEEGT